MTIKPVGEQLREWRQRRRMSQLDLSLEAEISARHVSFLETGRAKPSRDMLLHLAEQLDVPLRERNLLLLGAGFAPAYSHISLDDPALADVKAVMDSLLAAHEPFPALAVDRHWTLVSANKAVGLLIGSVDDASLLTPPVNVLRLSLHPGGLAGRILNLKQWRGHILERLHRQLAATADPALRDLADELAAYPQPGLGSPGASTGTDVIVPLRIATQVGTLSLLSATTMFGAPNDVTLSELALETFLPADGESRAALEAAARAEKVPS